MKWNYLDQNSVECGPVDRDELQKLATAGAIRPDSRIRLLPHGQWVAPGASLFADPSNQMIARSDDRVSLGGWVIVVGVLLTLGTIRSIYAVKQISEIPAKHIEISRVEFWLVASVIAWACGGATVTYLWWTRNSRAPLVLMILFLAGTLVDAILLVLMTNPPNDLIAGFFGVLIARGLLVWYVVQSKRVRDTFRPSFTPFR